MDWSISQEDTQSMLSRFLAENVQGFIAVLSVYGKPMAEGQIITKQAVEGMRKQIEEHPEKAGCLREGVPFAIKRMWLEEDDEVSGRLMAEYTRNDKVKKRIAGSSRKR